MSEPLIPDDVRKLYEELIADGGRLLSDEVVTDGDAQLQALLSRGLAMTVEFLPPLLLPASPEAAFAHTFTRWYQTIDAYPGHYARLLQAISRLQGATVAALAARDAHRACVVITAKAHVIALRHVLARSASRRIRACNTGPYGEPRRLPSGEPHRLRTGYIGPPPTLINHGGRSQILTDRQTALATKPEMVAGYHDGEEIRLIEQKLPMKLLIVDDDTALVPLGPYGNPCLLIRDRGLIAVFAMYFSAFWKHGVPWAPDGIERPHKNTTLRQRIVECLAAGLKDEAIARQLGMSARTVRRHVAALMQELGATTRFAAGVAAFRQGLVGDVPQEKGSAATLPSRAGASKRLTDA